MEDGPKIIMSNMFFVMAFLIYIITAVNYLAYWYVKKKWLGQLATTFAYMAAASTIMVLITRATESGYAPFSNLYESMVLFVTCLTVGYLIMEYKQKTKVMGGVVMTIAVLAMFAAWSLPYKYKSVQPLNPALQNKWHWMIDMLTPMGMQSYAIGWLDFHVFLMFLSYGAFGVAFGVSIMYLLKVSAEEKGSNNILLERLPSSEMLDELTYRLIAVGFPILFLGIMGGAAWANYAWGSYWSWDPKETWSLITWFIYGAYLHARFTLEWPGKRTAYLSILGFSAVIFLYWGVSFIIPGLHAYA